MAQQSLTPLERIDRLAALIPPPRLHRHRYQGMLAPSSPLRAATTACGREDGPEVPAPEPVVTASHQQRASRSPVRVTSG